MPPETVAARPERLVMPQQAPLPTRSGCFAEGETVGWLAVNRPLRVLHMTRVSRWCRSQSRARLQQQLEFAAPDTWIKGARKF